VRLLWTTWGRGFPARHNRAIAYNHIEGVLMRGNVAAFVLIALGVFFLLTNLGLISVSLRELMRVWWPAALIAVGLALFFTPGGKK
jgi:hypothetical protein